MKDLPHPLIFFYGSFINDDVLRNGKFKRLAEFKPALITGYEFRIAPRANLIRCEGGISFGGLTRGTHDDLKALYSYAETTLGERYLPYPVTTLDWSGRATEAITYICQNMRPAPVEDDYVERIAVPATQLGFPDWYIEHIRSFLGSA